MCRKSHSYEGLGPEIRLSNQSRRLIVSTVFRRVEKRFSQLKAGLAYGFYDTVEAVPLVKNIASLTGHHMSLVAPIYCVL